MITHTEIAALDALADHCIVADARRVYAAACERQQVNATDIVRAKQALVGAGEAHAAVLARAARGEAVAPREIASAAQAMRDAGAAVDFALGLAVAIESERARLDLEVQAAQRKAYLPALAHAGRVRTEAAAKLDAAAHALRAAERSYDQANAAVAWVADKTGLPVAVTIGITAARLSEREERDLWARAGIDIQPIIKSKKAA